MKRISILLMICTCSIVQMSAQSIIGQVVDERNHPLPFVSVVLKNLPDSVYVSGVATDNEGLFSLPAKAEKEYILQVSYIGYVTVNKTCKAGDVGVITLKYGTSLM